MSKPKGNFRNQEHTVNGLNYKVEGVKHKEKISTGPECIEAHV